LKICLAKRLEIKSRELGLAEFGKSSSPAVSNILANGNIRLGMCEIGDTNRYEIVPARGAKLELKIRDKVEFVNYVAFDNQPYINEFELLY